MEYFSRKEEEGGRKTNVAYDNEAADISRT
jgi:hypothetical protein